MVVTWSEDRATLRSDPSAVPGARAQTPGRFRPGVLSTETGRKALNLKPDDRYDLVQGRRRQSYGSETEKSVSKLLTCSGTLGFLP
jgi:hypothetical protein